MKRRSKRARKARQIVRIVTAVYNFTIRHPVCLAIPLFVCALSLAEFGKAEHQIEKTNMDLTMEKIYERSLRGTYEFPWNTMSQDWEVEQVEGFYYHDISDDCKKRGGEFPTIIQVYTYIVCQQKNVDYEMVFALIEHESLCRWNAEGDNGASIGLMQIQEKWHKERMEKLEVYDLKNPFQNVMVGVDYLAEIQQNLNGTVPEKELPYYVLSAYNYGMEGARENLWKYGTVRYKYNMEIMDRAEQLKKEKETWQQKICTTNTN